MPCAIRLPATRSGDLLRHWVSASFSAGGPDPGQTRSRSVSQCADHLDEDAIWSPLAIAPLTLTGTAVSIDNLGHLTYQLWLIWIIAASVALSRVRRERIDVGAVVVASS